MERKTNENSENKNKRNRIEMRQDFYLAFYRLIEHELIMHIISQSVSDVQRMQF